MIEIDDNAAWRLLDHIACRVSNDMRGGKTLEEIDGELNLRYLKKKDRIAVFMHMVERFVLDDKEVDAVTAHLRTLKRRKRSPQATRRPPATILPFRPEDRPDL